MGGRGKCLVRRRQMMPPGEGERGARTRSLGKSRIGF